MNSDIRAILILGLLLFLPGCGALPALLGALSAASRGGDVLESAIAVADAGQDAFFARHPSVEREPVVKAALRKAIQGLAAYRSALAAAKAIDDGDLLKAKEEAVESYRAAKKLLDEMGIPSATPPEGGSESEHAPIPEPFALPTADQIAVRL